MKYDSEHFLYGEQLKQSKLPMMWSIDFSKLSPFQQKDESNNGIILNLHQ